MIITSVSVGGYSRRIFFFMIGILTHIWEFNPYIAEQKQYYTITVLSPSVTLQNDTDARLRGTCNLRFKDNTSTHIHAIRIQHIIYLVRTNHEYAK